MSPNPVTGILGLSSIGPPTLYLTYFIDSNHVYKHTQVLIIKTYDLENHEFDTPICENLEIVIDTSKYSVGHRSGCLERDIPIKTTQFKFYYLDKII